MNESKIKIRDLPEEERPRERLAKYGPEALSNAELLAIILRTGMKGDIRRLIWRINSLTISTEI